MRMNRTVLAWISGLLIAMPVYADEAFERLSTITAQIPADWWVEHSWDKTAELETFLSSYKLSDTTGAEARLWLGRNYRVLGDYARAIQELRRVVNDYAANESQQRAAYHSIAQLYYWYLKDYAAALAEYQRVARLFPKNWEGQDAEEFIGHCYVALGQRGQALQAYQVAYRNGAGSINSGIAMASLLLEEASADESASRSARFQSLLVLYRELLQRCPVEERGGEARIAILDGIYEAFSRWDTHLARAKRFLEFQRYGAAGPDELTGTADDVSNPLASL